MLVLNAMDFIYLCGQVREEKKPLSSLMASGLAMVSQGTSVILPAIEKGLEARSLRWPGSRGLGRQRVELRLWFLCIQIGFQ
ncbi:hypothetical protein ACVXG7_22225 [Enterobacter hormaechei]